MATEIKTPRLLAAAKEFNIGKDTLVEFLLAKNFEINASNPNTKLTEEMYDALQAEFAKDKLAKRKSDEIALPKNNVADSRKKAAETDASKVKSASETDKPGDTEIKAQPQSSAIMAEPQEEVSHTPAIEAPQPEEAKTPDVEIPAVVATPTVAAADEATKAEPKTGRIEGPNILGKINLDEINQATRPKKGAAAKKVAEPEVKPEPQPAAVKEKQTEPETPVEQPKEEKKQEIEHPVAAAPEVPETPPAPVVTETAEPEVRQPAATTTPVEEEPKQEHIEMKAPRLEGPKIIGKIELPVSSSAADRQESREKRNRKRIPVQKKPESFKPDSRNSGNNNTNQGTSQQGQSGGAHHHRRDGHTPGQHQQGQGGNRGGFDRNRGGDHRDRNNDRRGGGNNRFNNQPATPPQEIDEKQIQRKIQETQAKLAGGGNRQGGKVQKSKYRRDKRELMAEKRAAAEATDEQTIQVTEFISVSEFASLLNVNFTDIISKCMSLGIMVSINQRLDAEVIELVANEFGFNVEFINLEQEADNEEEEVDNDEDLSERAPIVTIMGHVDHGKTSLLDYIRSANVVAGEAGGITQHIGAYQVKTSTGKRITFLDTPGHEAFTAMRARGAKVADIAVIVIAADDAIMPQTKEAISHAQAAGLPMIFALNKMDKEGANPEKIKEQLANMNILVEDWGGKYQSQEISAKKGVNIDVLLEKILLEAELLELKANPDRAASGSVIEASLDKGRGYVSTVLVQNGTLNQGEMIVCGQYYGKIKAMFNERGQRVNQAGPSAPVQVLGLNGAPQAGEKFKMYVDENEAKDIANHRAQILREQGIRTRKHITLDEIGRRLALGNFKELAIIIKGDFDGSVEALSDSLQKLSTEEVAVNVVHKGVGQITESDVLLATASDAIILGFQVRPSLQAGRLAEQENIEIRTYSIIYDAIEEVKSAMEGLLEPKVEKRTVCNVEVREVYKIGGVGTIAGCYVLDGKITRNTKVNLVRDGIVIYTGELASLKRYKDDVKEVNTGYECGLMIKNYNDIRVSDIIEGYEEVEVKRTL